MQHRVARFVVRQSDLIVHPRDIVIAASGCQQDGSRAALYRIGGADGRWRLSLDANLVGREP
jgi:hypothetical protein